MSENCEHDCSQCKENCPSRQDPKSFLVPANAKSSIKRVIGVVSGKGGVGKSTVTAMLAVLLERRGLRVGILDADVTGPSIPKIFGVHEQATSDGEVIFPAESKTGIKMMSVNLLLPDETDPVVWRGPIIGGTVKQFWTDVAWGEIDVLMVDMPPGTGDVALTVFQSLPLDGVIIVTTPQDLVSMVVQKAVKMAGMMNIPVLGVVENNSWFVCSECGKKHMIFGESHAEEVCAQYGLKLLAQLPISPDLAGLCDDGMIELAMPEGLDPAADAAAGV